MTYNKGDKIEIELDDSQVYALKTGSVNIMFHRGQITKHTQAQFDWSQVKPGMAFLSPGSFYPDARIFVGRYYDEYVFRFLNNEDKHGYYRSFDLEYLLAYYERAPEHDVEVTK